MTMVMTTMTITTATAPTKESANHKTHQRSGVVSGDDSVGSGNNVNVQNQENEGNNVAGQQD